MNYSFDTLKALYDKYTIEKDTESSQTVVVDRKTHERWAFEGPFAESVKFAHTWVFATQYNPSGKTSSISKNKISDDDYGRAFSESSRNIYNTIMEHLVTYLQESEKMLGCETLIKEVKEDIDELEVENIVRGLYVKKGGYVSLFFWCLKIAGMDDLLKKVQEQGHEPEPEQERKLAA